MGILQCLFRICCEDENDPSNYNDPQQQHHHQQHRGLVTAHRLGNSNNNITTTNNNNNNSMTRLSPGQPRFIARAFGNSTGILPGISTSYQAAPSSVRVAAAATEDAQASLDLLRHTDHASHDEDDERDRGVMNRCCFPRNQGDNSSNHHTMSCDNYKQSTHVTNIHDFFRQLQDRWQKFESLEGRDRSDTVDSSSILGTSERSTNSISTSMSNSNSIFRRSKRQQQQQQSVSQLRTAHSFDASRDILTINPEEIVLPGSELQQQMAAAMSLKKTSALLYQHEEECVICMDGFDPTNPRMPTLCGCGENKTYFHLPCLYQWIEQSHDCPSCRQRLTWEEF